VGTNFYLKARKWDDKKHIGKRSAAGLYCFDCNEPLNSLGLAGVHSGYAIPLTACPTCGKKPVKEPLEGSSAGLELGFNKDPYQKKTGVKSASSFTFAMPLEELKEKLSHKRSATKCVVDEYGTGYTRDEFMAILVACPIHFTDMIGQEFS
jgi:hypothetical protein